jgi:TldD protein
MDDALIDAAESVLADFEAVDDAAHAEVGGVERRVTDVVVTAEDVRSATDLRETGVWWRVFADGAADYRYSTSLEPDHLEELVERSLRSAKLLDQSAPARYDEGTMHRATHPGWTRGDASLDELSADEKADRVRTALADAVGDLDADRVRSSYRDERTEIATLTTSGTTLTATLDRASTRTVVVPANGPKIDRHDGATTGGAFLDSLTERFEALAGRARRVGAAERTGLDHTGRTEVVLGPLAAASLVHQLSHYLEIDSVYFGSSPFEIGDRIGSSVLTVEDGVPAGSWAARAYDAEGRPTRSTTLVGDGVVANHLYDAPSAIEEDAFPAGNLIPSLGFEDPPRVHARHLDVAAGDSTPPELREGADLYVERFGTPRVANEATRTKRNSTMPPSVLYAKDIAATTPSEFDDERTDQEIRFPIAEAYAFRDGERTSLVSDGVVGFSPSDLQTVSGLGSSRRTLTGTCEKHKSTLPFAVTAPAMRLSADVHDS